jgi:hypothetical protein
MEERRVRRIALEKDIEFIEAIGNEVFIASGQTLHILSMGGDVSEDLQLPGRGVDELWRTRHRFYVRMKGGECYSFLPGGSVLMRVNARNLKRSEHPVFPSGERLLFLDEETLKIACSLVLPEPVIDIAEMGQRMYILFRECLCYAETSLLMQNKTGLVPIGNLSHMRFTAIRSNGRDFIALEAPGEIVVYNGSDILWLLRKPRNFLRCEVSRSLLIAASDTIELYNLRDGTLHSRLDVRTGVFAYDCIRRTLWVYHGSLYEVDLSEPYPRPG